MGKGGGGSSKPTEYEKIQAGIAKRQDVRAQTMEGQYLDPIRGVVTPQILGALGTNPFATSLTAAQRAPIEGQYNQAKRALMNTATRGGQLRSMMSGLERDRANAISQAQNAARETGIGRALQFAGGALPTQAGLAGQENAAMSGLGAVNESIQKRKQQAAQESAAKGQGMGSLAGAGMMAASMAGMF